MPVDTQVLRAADRGHILRALATFSGKPASQWLTAAHPAAGGFLPAAWRDVRLLSNQQMAEAVAAAAPNHCVDGWSYAARATSAFLAGDLHAARHLAYYAQLRAALSMLGHVGIGIFNGINFVIDAGGQVIRLDPSNNARSGLGTHNAVWEALDQWVLQPSSARAFLELVRIGSTSLANCMDIIWPGSSAVSVAGTLIEAWGVDLRRGKDDHLARNISSYNPGALGPLPDVPAERIEFVEGFWALFEPVAVANFDMLDRHLLRSLLWQQHDIVAPRAAKQNGAIGRRYEDLPASIRRIASRDFLVGISEPIEPALVSAAKSSQSPAMAHEMIARALLLLRASTAFTISNFSDAGVAIANGAMRAWIDNVAERRGFWDPANPLADPVDLWEDVKLALEELAKSKSPTPTSMNAWITRAPVGLPTIAETERISVWSLGS